MMNLKNGAAAILLLISAGLQVSAQTVNYSWKNLPKIARPVFKKDTFNIIKYGARPDGITLNTTSINNAIIACSNKGGGVVEVPAGLWLTGPIVFKNKVNLHISQGALLLFTDDKSQYKMVEGNWEGHSAYRNESPISGTDLTDIAITGKGIIDGNGEVWRSIGKNKLTAEEWRDKVASGGVVSANGEVWFPSAGYQKGFSTPGAGTIKPGTTSSDYADIKDFFRPNMVVFTNCKRILLQDVTFQNSPAWNLHMLICQDLTLQGVQVLNPWNAQNGDGVDVESCKNVLIDGSSFDVGDDGICVKSGRDEEGRRRGKPTENMIVRNSTVYRAHGGFVIGSEMSGGARNIFVSNCTFIGTDIGLRFKTTRGRGGIVEKIYIKNIAMRNIVNEAILFDMYYMGRPPSDADINSTNFLPVTAATPQFRDFYVSSVVCNGAGKALLIRGLPEMSIKGIHLEDITLKADKGADIIESEGITLKNVYLESKDQTKPLITVQNSNNVSFNGLRYGVNTNTLFNISGKRTGNIRVIGSNLSNAKTKATFKNSADEKALLAD